MDKTYCRDCKFYRTGTANKYNSEINIVEYFKTEYCAETTKLKDTYFAPNSAFIPLQERNKNNDCDGFAREGETVNADKISE